MSSVLTSTNQIRDICPKCGNPKRKYYYTIEGFTYKGMCFHCGYKIVKQQFKKPKLPTKKIFRNLTTPFDATTDWGFFPKEAMEWLLKYGITQEDCKKYNIFYATSWGKDRLWLTITDKHYQGRDLTGKHEIKYLTKKEEDGIFFLKGNEICIVTEDILSAIKANKFGYSSLALLGTHMKDMHLKKLLDSNIKKVLVCLDNDNAKVRKAQRYIANRVNNFIPCKLVRLDQDFKELKEFNYDN